MRETEPIRQMNLVCMNIIIGLLFCLTETFAHTTVQPELSSTSAVRYGMKFEHLSVENGLSQNTIHCITQDRYGFMWFGTWDGLNRFDGYKFTVYRHEPKNSNSLSHNAVISICEDRSGTLWIGTRGGGLNRFMPDKGTFVRFQHQPGDPHSLSNDVIHSICEDRLGNLWIGTGDGLNLFDRKSNRFICFRHDPDNQQSLSNNIVSVIYEDRQGNIWIGTSGGLNQWIQETRTFIRYRADFDAPNRLKSDRILSIYEDRYGALWIGTKDGGLYKLDRKTSSFSCFQHSSDDNRSISQNTVHAILENRTDLFWVGTADGLNILDRDTRQFIRYPHDHCNPGSLSDNVIFNIYEDRSGLIWIGTEGGGIDTYNIITGHFVHYNAYTSNLNNNKIYAIIEDHNGLLWIGSEGGGICKFDKTTQQCESYRANSDEPLSLSDNFVYAIYEDRHGIIWIGTKAGLSKYDSETDGFTNYQFNLSKPLREDNHQVNSIYESIDGDLWIGTWSSGLIRFDRRSEKFISLNESGNDSKPDHDNVWAIHEDREGFIWFGTLGNGLHKLDPQTGSHTRYRYEPEHSNSLGHDFVFSILEDNAGNLWIGTLSGLNKFDRSTERFTRFTTKDGFQNEAVMAILEDKRGILWLSALKGITKFDPKTSAFRNYATDEGLPDIEFTASTACDTRSGEIYFGGLGGIISFYPEKINENDYVPPIVITDFKIFNESVSVGPDSPLTRDIIATRDIILPHTEKMFSFEYAALNYISPDRNQYAYRMEGIDDEWNYVGNRRFVTYAILPAGDYIFRVKGSNNHGVWNEVGVSINIKIKQAYWETRWFKALAAFVFTILLISILSFRFRLIIERNKAFADKKAAEASDRMKSEFIANMSHEIRTPISAILGFVEILRKKITDEDHKQYLSVISLSGQTLLHLVDDILDFSKLENGKLQLNIEPVDLNGLLVEIQEAFLEQAHSKGIELIVEKNDFLPASLWLDKVRLRQILLNLTGNAVKFTHQGYVKLSASTIDKSKNGIQDIFLYIQDTGIGLQEYQKEKIFDAFKKQDGTDAAKYRGIGLGLTLVHRLVKLMGGDISVESEIGKGSQFIVFLRDVKTSAIQEKSKSQVISVFDDLIFEKASILIADDSSICRDIVKSFLEPYDLEIIEVENGRKSIDAARRHCPDLILMDIFMPEMNGDEVIKLLKNDKTMKDIPVIILSGASQKTEGGILIMTGGDGYLKKPFSYDQILSELIRFLPHSLKGESKETLAKSNRNRASCQDSSSKITRQNPDLLNYLENESMKQWETVKKRLIFQEIKEFAQSISELGIRYQKDNLVNWSNRLRRQADHYETNNLLCTLDAFPDIVKEIQSNNEFTGKIRED